jgi:hypothetical protein
MLWQGCPTHGQHASPGSCHTWRNTHRTFATSPGQPTWWLTLSLQAARPRGGGRASLGGALCKSALRVSGCGLAGRQAKLLYTFTTWRGSWSGGRAAGGGHFLSQDGRQPSQLSKHAAGRYKSSSLTVRTVQVEGASLLCDVARGITRPLVPLVDRPAVFHAIHSNVPRLPAVPEGKGLQAACDSSARHSCAGMQVFPHARGPGGPSTSLF